MYPECLQIICPESCWYISLGEEENEDAQLNNMDGSSYKTGIEIVQ
jgi:hypothetical protein